MAEFLFYGAGHFPFRVLRIYNAQYSAIFRPFSSFAKKGNKLPLISRKKKKEETFLCAPVHSPSDNKHLRIKRAERQLPQ